MRCDDATDSHGHRIMLRTLLARTRLTAHITARPAAAAVCSVAIPCRLAHSIALRSAAAAVVHRSLFASVSVRLSAVRAFSTAPTSAGAPTPAAAGSKQLADGEVTMIMYGNGFEREVSGREGETLLNVAQLNDIDQIEGACEGCMCCSTCHMIFDPETYAAIGPVSDDEQDIIDRAAGVTDTSRLGCQVRVSKKLQDAKIRIPSEFVNQMS